jgi:hypothetical protein
MTAITETQTTQIRFLIGDPDEVLVDEDTLDAMWSLSGENVYECAALCADGLAAKFSKSASFSVEGLSISNSTKSERYADLAKRLRALRAGAVGGIGVPVVTGISIGTMDSVDDDSDRVPSRVKMGGEDNPSALNGWDE